jgi:Tol biopolymer transport system component
MFTIIALLWTAGAVAQTSPQFYDYPQNHLPWFTIEGEQFLVHYQEGSERSAQVASKVAEEIYDPVTSLYDYEPDRKISIVLRDRQDYSNGAAFFFDDKIEIWVPALDTPLRGTHDWMRNVITHEFTHIVQLQASMTRSKTIPAIYFQWLSYEDVRRPDVLYGFPNGIVTLPFATVAIPAWFAEGTAQYQRSGLTYDYWDSHRDMLLRSRILNDTYLGFTEMGIFTSKTSIERETNYNQGFAFVIYLVERFGEQVISDITNAAAESGKTDFSKVIKAATNISGQALFEDWIAERKTFYNDQISQIDPVEYTHVEPDGFFNFYPQFSPDSSSIAYLTNRGRDSGQTALILRSDSSIVAVEDLGGTQQLDSDQQYRSSHGMGSNLALDFISNRFSYSPDGSKLIFSRAKKNRVGETYQDLYIFDIESEESRQITHSKRIQDPAWHPSGGRAVAVQQHDGTQNLVTVDLETSEITQLTNYSGGETIYTPVWHPSGETIYMAGAKNGTRNIYKYDLNSGSTTALTDHRFVDFRDPWIDPDGTYLYFSSDMDGIFNIYREHIESGETERITTVHGGAFMPHVQSDTLYFSNYVNDGYKISKTPLKDEYNPIIMTPPRQQQVYIRKPGTPSERMQQLNRADDGFLGSLPFGAVPDTTMSVDFEIETEFEPDSRTWSPYTETITGLSVFPIVRFDNYSKLEGSNSRLLTAGNFGSLGENLWRDMKVGAYLSSRDVTEKISIFGGALFGFGSTPTDGVGDFISPSRLNDLDRDLFLIFEHRGIPFIKTSWSPTISIELYNLKRNVRDGLSIEEFPCTSCLPETKNVDIRYSIWEANLFLRSKLNRWSLLELGAAYSPYRVSTDGFFSDELQQFVPGSTSQYFKGSTFSASYIAELIKPSRNMDIAPIGFKSRFTYKFEPSQLLDEFEVNDGILSPVFQKDYNHSVEFKNRYGFGLGGERTGMITTRGFAYLNNPDDFFYLDYIGGLTGLRSYPFFSVGGRRTAFLRASYLTPLFQSINQQLGAYTIDKVFAHLYAETGNGWGGQLDVGNQLKSGFGAELRMSFNSHYLFPLKFFVNGSYGLSEFDVKFSDDFITGSGDNTVTYGREFLFYFGLTFDFDLL